MILFLHIACIPVLKITFIHLKMVLLWMESGETAPVKDVDWRDNLVRVTASTTMGNVSERTPRSVALSLGKTLF